MTKPSEKPDAQGIGAIFEVVARLRAPGGCPWDREQTHQSLRPYLLEDIPYPKVPRRLPTILTVEEVTRLIDGARTLTDRTMLMVLYSTGMRNAELRHLQVADTQADLPRIRFWLHYGV